jgi:hypothetical protein
VGGRSATRGVGESGARKYGWLEGLT